MSCARARELFKRVRARPYPALSAGVFTATAYLCVATLDYTTVWHDEAVVFTIAKNLIEQGDIVGWDGRNLVGGLNGNSLNDDLRDVAPPVQYLVTALGFMFLGFNETGARAFHALAGLLALAVFHCVLRQQVPHHPRLTFLIFLFAAWSAQLLLYFRQARYYSVTVLCLMAAIYLYERYWRTKRVIHLAALTGVALLAFLNHYTSGTATMLALGAWHLLLRGRTTGPRDWLAFVVGGAVAVLLALMWLGSVGLIGGTRSPSAGFRAWDYGPASDLETLFFFKLWVCFRDLFTADWISWPVFLWFAATGLLAWWRTTTTVRMPFNRRSRERGTRQTGQPAQTAAAADNQLPLLAVSRILLLGGLCALFTTLLSPTPVWLPSVQLDLRYFVAALPLLLAMKGLFVEWLWQRSKALGATALTLLLFTSAAAAPFNAYNTFTQRPTFGAHLPAFVREIHRGTYRTSTEVVSDYLLRNARKDDFVEVPTHFSDRDALTVYIGHHVRFCNVLDDRSPLPRVRVETLGPHLYRDRCDPDWIVIFGERLIDPDWQILLDDYEIAAQPDVYHYPTQRPEINWHAFEPLPAQGPFLHILRRRSDRP